MIYLFAFLVNISLTGDLANKTRYVILFDHREATQPIPNSIEGFWSNQSQFDTIIIEGGWIIKKLEKEIDYFKSVGRKSILNKTFNVNNAVIRYDGAMPVDTLYTDQFFRFWKIKEALYQDKKEYFNKRFAVFSYKY